MVRRAELPNGLRVIVREDHRSPLVAVVTHVGSGYLNEDPGEAGISHLLEHMILRGTDTHPGFEDIPRAVRELGGVLNGATGFDHSETYLVVPSDKVEDALALASEIYTEPRFDREALGKVKEIIRGEIEQKLENPVDFARDLLLREVFSDGVQPAPGDRQRLAAIASLTVEQLRRFHEDHYRPPNTVVSVVGDVDAAAVLQAVRARFGEVPRGEMRRHAGSELVEPKALRFHRVMDSYDRNVVMVGFPLPLAAKRDLPALRLLGALVVDGAASRLRVPFMIEHDWAQGLSTRVVAFDRAGLFELAIEAPNTFEDQALREFFVQLDQIRRYGVRPQELENARTRVAIRRRIAGEDILTVARRQARAMLPLASGDRSADEAEAKVTVADLQRAITRWLAIPRAAVVELLDRAKMNSRPFYGRLDAAAMQGHLEGAVLAGADRQRGLPPKAPLPPSWVSRLELAGWAREFEKAPREDGLRRFEYPNGAVLLVREIPTLDQVDLSIWFRGGRVTETANSAGQTALLQKLMVRRTVQRTQRDLADDLDALGTTLRPVRTLDAFGFSLDVQAMDLPYAFDLLYDVVANPQFEGREFGWAKFHQIRQVHADDGRLFVQSQDLLRRAAWGDHPYGLPEMGNEILIKKAHLSSLQDLHVDLCNPRNAVIVVTGGVDAEGVHEFLDLYMRQWSDISDLYPAGAGAFFQSELIDPLPPVEEGRSEEVHRSSPLAALQLGFSARGARAPEHSAQELLQWWLGGPDGPLAPAVLGTPASEGGPAEGDAPVVYRLTTGEVGGALGGLLTVYAASTEADLPRVESSLVETLHAVAEQGPDPDRFLAVQAGWSTRFLLGLQRCADEGRFIARREIEGLPPQTPLDHREELRAVSVDEVSDLARKILREAPHAIGRVHGAKASDEDQPSGAPGGDPQRKDSRS